MKKLVHPIVVLALVLVALAGLVPLPAQAVSTNIVISEFRTRGPNGGNDDFIELYNLSTSAVNIGGWKIKGSNNAGGGTAPPRATIPQNTILNPGCHYLLTNSTVSNGPYSGSVPGDQTYATGISDDGGIAITTASDVVIDAVGMSAGSAFKEDGTLTPLTTNVNRGYERKPGGILGSGQDTDTNTADFQLISPSDPQNLSSPCIGSDAAPFVASTVPANGASNVPLNSSITINFSEAVNVSGSWFSLSCATSGTHNATASGGPTTFTLDPGADFAGGESCTLTVLAANVTDQDLNDPPDNMTIDFTAGFTTINPTNPTGVGLANPNALYTGDPTLLTVTVTPGTNPTSTDLAVTCDLTTIGGSDVQELFDDGSNGDVTAGDNTFSYLATIANNTTGGAKSLACTISDAQSRTGSVSIGLTVTAILPIGTVQGSASNSDDGATFASPFAGQTVTIQGVIFEKALSRTSSGGSSYGFFLQNRNGNTDGDPNSSDGIYVYIGGYSTLRIKGGGYYTPKVGDEVILQGPISEYYNFTEIGNPYLLKVVHSGVDLSEVPAVEVNPPANLADANRYWERLEGMRVQVPQNSIVLGGRNVFNPADAEVWVAAPDSTIALRLAAYERRAFRDAHPLDDNYDSTNWDGNGYRILMGSWGIKATAGDSLALIAPARTFETVTNAPAGGLNYTYSKYRIEITDQPALSDGVDPAANNPPETFNRSIYYSIADYNLENLYDYRDNPFSGCDFAGNSGCPKVAPFLAAVSSPFDYVPASDAAYQARLNDIALQIINDLHSPDILMVQEVENQDICSVPDGVFTCGTTDNADGKPDVLQELALKIASLGGPAYNAAFDRDSSDLRGIAPSFMYRTDRVQLVDPTGDPVLGTDPAIVYPGATVLNNSDVSNPKTLNAVLPSGVSACETSWVFPRAPDIALFRIYGTNIGVGSYQDVYVINNHFKSGPDTCTGHRTEQAKYNAAIVAFLQAANPSARIVLGGDLNVYPRPDDIAYGASDQLGSLYDPSLELKNLWEVLLGQAPESAYSYVYLGMAQTLDQMFVSQPMLADLKQFRIAHINSDFPADYPGDVARGTSDHDPNVARFCRDVTPPTLNVTVSPNSLWPPNHKYVTVKATVNVSDDADPNPTWKLVSVTSSEPDNGLGDGDTANDFVIVDNTTFKLRAERSGGGNGRVYTITYQATDACGNSTLATATVTVPHDKGK